MNRRISPAVAVVVLSLLSFACGGGGGGGRGPTEPSGPSGKRLQFTVSAALGDFSPGAILEAAAFFDGREVGRMDWTRAGGACTLVCGIAGDVQGISSGNHTVRFTSIRQDRAVIDYVVVFSGVLTDPAAGSRETINAPPQRIRLRAGESVTFTVRI